MRLFVFGLGYSARAAIALAGSGLRSVAGTVRSADKAAALTAEGIAAHVFDGGRRGETLGPALREATHLLVSVPPGAADPALTFHGEDIAAAPALRWIGYYSTVGVYGDHGGGWVDESTPPRPLSRRSLERRAAEEAWADLAAARGLPLATLRIAGIYGPGGRNVLAGLADGTARRIVKPGQVFNRIHVADIAAATLAAARAGHSGIVNLADDEPGPNEDVTLFAARLMGVEPPPEVPFEAANLPPMALSFYGENKRVANRALHALLPRLAYPTYREGLTALWEKGDWRA